LLDEHRFAEEGHVIWEGMRVIAASRRDLDAEVCAGRFRGDLSFRLSVVMITVPPLRDRPEDLPRLTEYLLDNLARRHHRHDVRLAPEVQEVFGRYHWPGNVRELVSILDQAVVLLRDDVIRTRDLPDRLLVAPSRAHVSEPSAVYPQEIQRA
jgi:DNA-binding NtrC family response regulator